VVFVIGFYRVKLRISSVFSILFSLVLLGGHELLAHCIDDAEDLIDAINEANVANEDTTIDLCGNVISLQNTVNTDIFGTGLPAIGVPGSDYELTIKNGTIQRDINAADEFRLILVSPWGRLVLDDVTLSNGFGYEFGGAIFNLGVIEEIENCTISNNIAFIGGAIFNVGAILRIRDTAFVENISFVGGAITNVAYIERVSQSTFTENESCFGAGILNVGYMELIEDTTIAQNEATGEWCGGNNAIGSFSGAPLNDSPGAQAIYQFVNSKVGTANEPWFEPGQGGGIYNIFIINKINESIIVDNEAETEGGGIFNGFFIWNDIAVASNGHITANHIDNSEINSITNTTISGNSAEFGGGIFNIGEIDDFIANTVSGNSAEVVGGGIFNGSFFTVDSVNNSTPEIGVIGDLYNSTFSDNTAGESGGGIFNDSTIENFTNSTIVNNHADDLGGGIYNTDGASIYLVSSIVGKNIAETGTNTGPDIYDETCNLKTDSLENNSNCALTTTGSVVDGGNNLIGTNDANLFMQGIPNDLGSYVGYIDELIDPRIGLLDNYGGPTQTIPLFSNSIAIGAGANPNELLFDQRGIGFPRETFGFADIGAFQTPQTGPEGIQGPQGEPGRDGDNGSDGADGAFGGGGFLPLPPPALPVVPPIIPVARDEVSATVKTNADVAPEPVAPVLNPNNSSIAAGCSVVFGQGQESSSLLLWVMLAMLFFRAQRRAANRA
jgi:hypothetical protein